MSENDKKIDIKINPAKESRSETVEEYSLKQAIADYRRNSEEVFNGVLATISRESSKSASYPFTSVVPFVLDKDGYAIIMAADISQHYQNMVEDPKVALFLRQSGKRANVQTQWRMTITGKAVKVETDDDGVQSYFRHYPASKSYSEFHVFHFLRIVPEMVHIVQNFGQIAWLDPVDIADPCPMSDAELLSAVNHMNEDHVDSLYTYLQNAGHTVDGARKIELVAINHRRFVIKHQNQLYSITFPNRVSNMTELRQAMIKLTYPSP